MGYGYDGSPVNPAEWKRENVKRKVDVILNNGIRLECKNIDGKVFRSWYVRDWKSKGSCVFAYRGDLKLSESIYSEFHPIIFHYFLLPVYLEYNIRLFRDTVTSLYKADKHDKTSKYEADDYECIKLKGSAKKVHSGRFEVESFRNKVISEKSITLSDCFAIASKGNVELEEYKHPEPRTFPLQPCEVRTSCTVS